jgi:hypothetical protein
MKIKMRQKERIITIRKKILKRHSHVSDNIKKESKKRSY